LYATYPVYIPSARWARENDEIELWRESFKINKECRDYINNEAPMAYHEERLPAFVKELAGLYGIERAMYVIGRTVVGAEWDKRYYGNVRERAEQFSYRDMKEAKALHEEGKDPYRTADNTTSLCSNIHSVMLNAIFQSLMKMEREQPNLPSAAVDRDNELDEGVEQ